jgi:enamine deaminase RidA (YjgF/YER057c/UK114 family)
MAEVINPPQLAIPRGYSHAARASGTTIALAGQIGWDKDSKLVSTEFLPQFAQALQNLMTALAAAGGSAEDLISLRIYVTDKKQYIAAAKQIGETYRTRVGRHYPAMALVQVADLLEEGALVEIEGLAVVPEERR